jgi:hypothetical protein
MKEEIEIPKNEIGGRGVKKRNAGFCFICEFIEFYKLDFCEIKHPFKSENFVRIIIKNRKNVEY